MQNEEIPQNPITAPNNLNLQTPNIPPKKSHRSFIIVGVLLLLVIFGLIAFFKATSKKALGTTGMYAVDYSSVYYANACATRNLFWGVCTKYSYKKIPRADPKSFELVIDKTADKTYPLGNNFEYQAGYAKDKNYVYHLGRVLAGPDAQTFEFIGQGYSKDKNNIYFAPTGGSSWDGEAEKVVNKFQKIAANDGSFVVYDFSLFLAKDDNHIYSSGKVIPDVDAKTFEQINNGVCGYAKDKYNVYYNISDVAEVLQGADPQTFELLGNKNCVYAKDKSHVYLDTKILQSADPKTFQPPQ